MSSFISYPSSSQVAHKNEDERSGNVNYQQHFHVYYVYYSIC